MPLKEESLLNDMAEVIRSAQLFRVDFLEWSDYRIVDVVSAAGYETTWSHPTMRFRPAVGN